MNEWIKVILSIFIPEKIVIRGLIVEVYFLGDLKTRQDLNQIESLSYLKHNPFTGGRMLGVTAGGLGCDYFGQQLGFSKLQSLCLNLLRQHGVEDALLASKNKFYDGFEWAKEANSS